MIECPSCGKDVDEDVRFCGYCGYELLNLKKKTVLGMPTVSVDGAPKGSRRVAPATVVMASVSPEKAYRASEIEISPQNSGLGKGNALNVQHDGDEVALKGQNALHVAQFDSPMTQPIKTHTYEVSVDASGKAQPKTTSSKKTGLRDNPNRSTLILAQAIQKEEVASDPQTDGWPSPSEPSPEVDDFDFSGLDDGWGMPPTVDGSLPVTTETPRDEALEELIRATAQRDDAPEAPLPPTAELPTLTSDSPAPAEPPQEEPDLAETAAPDLATNLANDTTQPPVMDTPPQPAPADEDEHEAALADTLEASRATMLQSINSMSSHQNDEQAPPDAPEADLTEAPHSEASDDDAIEAQETTIPEDIGRSETLPVTHAVPDAGAMGVPSSPEIDAKSPRRDQGKETALIANATPPTSTKGTALIANTTPDADDHQAHSARPPAGSMDDPLDETSADEGLGFIKWILAAAIALVFFGSAALFVIYFLMT